MSPVGGPRYVLCGTLQLLAFLGYTYLAAFVVARGYDWISAGSGLIDTYLRSVLFGGVGFLVLSTLPIVGKWVLIGRWKPQQIRVWSLAYFRFWVVKALIRFNPLALLFVGSPLYALYLRLLGAKVGRGVVIFSRNVPVCTDLLTIGDATVIRKDSFFSGYRAQAGLIQTGAVTLGKDVLVGEVTVLDIWTSMGDRAQLGHSSSLHTGQAVPEGERWHGSPAEPTEVDYAVEPATCGTLKRAVHTAIQLLRMLFVYVPLMIGGVAILLAAFPHALPGSASLTSWPLYRDALAASAVLFFGGTLVGIVFACTVPRVLSLFIKPDVVYPLYGFHYSLDRAIERYTNSKFLTHIFGDSSYIVHFLRCLGYDVSPITQTGSNFGNEVKHANPYLSSVGTGTVVASGLSIVNTDFSSTSFRASRASIGAHSFLGNMIAYPSQAKTGENCLLATKVMVPMDGEVRENVGLLGSPCFEIPRSVDRDSRFDHLRTGDELRRRLAAKKRHNTVSIGSFLLARWFYVFVLMLAFFVADSNAFSTLAVFLTDVFMFVFLIGHIVVLERASTGFRAQRPKYCSIYEINFWRTERFFKCEVQPWLSAVFSGTPFLSVIWRLLGVRVGRRLFDDGSGFAEKNLVTIGDDVTLNAGVFAQCHSQEDFAFKSDHITIGAGCTIGVGAWLLYGVTMGDGAVLAPDSFLMKGAEVPPHERWGGNPAREMPEISLAANLQLGRDNANLQLGRDNGSNRTAALIGSN